MNCIECSKKITQITNKCKSCEKPICETCYQSTIKRSTNCSFYINYISWCDTCIWFYIG